MLSPDEFKKALEFIARLSYNKGKADERRGSEGPETLDEFIKQRIKDVEKLVP